MPLTVPVWIIAIATVTLAISMIIATFAIRRLLAAQSSQQRELGTQLAETLRQHTRDLRLSVDERRRAQACRVFIDLDRKPGIDGPFWQVTATVRNASDQPVYDLYVIWQHGNIRIGRPDRATRLLPGRDVCFERGPDSDANSGNEANGRTDGTATSPEPSAEPRMEPRTLTARRTTVDPAAITAFLTFRDTAGTRWTVREDGTLSDISPANPDTPAPQD